MDLPTQEPTDAQARVLSLVPALPDGLLDGLSLGGETDAAARQVDVVMCCAAADLPAMGRIFDALQRHGCVPMAMTGVERDPRRLTESAQAAGEPRLYVVCKTPSIDSGQAQRLVQAFARSGRRGRHQLLVLELDLERVYAAVPHVRRGADQLRRRLAEPSASETARTVQMPQATPRRTPAPAPAPAPRRCEPVDTSYAMHRRADGTGEQHIDRIVIDIDPRPVTPALPRRVSQRSPSRRRR
ncbi:MAG: hypothetical protein AAF721_11970 [Myxococcota bacterium]